MKTTISTFAIVSALVFGIAVSALVIQHRNTDSSRRKHVPIQMACAAGGIGSGCGKNRSDIQLGTIVVTPTQAERHYLASHDLSHHIPMFDSNRLTPAQTVRQAETG